MLFPPLLLHLLLLFSGLYPFPRHHLGLDPVRHHHLGLDPVHWHPRLSQSPSGDPHRFRVVLKENQPLADQ